MPALVILGILVLFVTGIFAFLFALAKLEPARAIQPTTRSSRPGGRL